VIRITFKSAAIQNSNVTCRVLRAPPGHGCNVCCRVSVRLSHKKTTTEATTADLQDDRSYLGPKPLTHLTSQHPQYNKYDL